MQRHLTVDSENVLANFDVHSFGDQNAPTIRRPTITSRNLVMKSTKYESFKLIGIFNLPKRVFIWIYSISLILLIILLAAFVSATPVDVIVQTSGASYSGIKMFIVIIVCVVYFILAVFMYFSRIYQYRIALNDIPSKSVYIPGEDDMPKYVYRAIDERLKYCLDLKNKISPMVKSSSISYPGLSPPEYIMNRNKERCDESTIFPPNSHYEDIVRSLGDKFRHAELLLEAFPKDFTFRDIVHFLAAEYLKSGKQVSKTVDITRLIGLYEKIRFGPSLIQEKEMLEFIVAFERFSEGFENQFGFSLRNPKVVPPNDATAIERNYLEKTVADQESALKKYQVNRNGIGSDAGSTSHSPIDTDYDSISTRTSEVVTKYTGRRNDRKRSVSSQGSVCKKTSSDSSNKSVIRGGRGPRAFNRRSLPMGKISDDVNHSSNSFQYNIDSDYADESSNDTSSYAVSSDNDINNDELLVYSFRRNDRL